MLVLVLQYYDVIKVGEILEQFNLNLLVGSVFNGEGNGFSYRYVGREERRVAAGIDGVAFCNFSIQRYFSEIGLVNATTLPLEGSG